MSQLKREISFWKWSSFDIWIPLVDSAISSLFFPSLLPPTHTYLPTHLYILSFSIALLSHCLIVVMSLSTSTLLRRPPCFPIRVRYRSFPALKKKRNDRVEKKELMLVNMAAILQREWPHVTKCLAGCDHH